MFIRNVFPSLTASVQNFELFQLISICQDNPTHKKNTSYFSGPCSPSATAGNPMYFSKRSYLQGLPSC